MGDRVSGQMPMRIEMATSEIEGAGILAWADPEQVIACVARSQPRESFTEFLAPRLAELGRSGPRTPERTAGPPERVSILIDRLRQAHTRLFRDNVANQTRRVVWPVIALVEDGIVYFVKGSRCWIFLLREGLASPLWVGGETTVATPPPSGLGESEKLNLAVSSIEVAPLDILVVLACETAEPPDRRAVTRVFDEIRDLRRACDGLVNLFGNEPGGAAAIAMRFVPIGNLSETSVPETAFEDLVEDLRSVRGEKTGHEVPGTSHKMEDPRSTLQSDMMHDSIPAPPPPSTPMKVVPVAPAPPPSVMPPVFEAPAPTPPPVPPAHPKAQEPPQPLPKWMEEASAPVLPPTPPVAAEAPSPPPPPSPVPRQDDRSPVSSKPFPVRRWALVFGGVVLAIAAVIGVPRGLQMVHRSSSGHEGGGVIRVESTPPATAISIDGVDQGTSTPAILDGITPGTHTLRLDLGPFGSIERKVRVETGETVDLSPRATGVLEVAATEARPGAETWTAGGKHMAVPCRLDTLPVGWKEVFYADDRLPLWQRRVPIRAGETTRLRINNAFSLDRALLTVETWTYESGKGLRETPDDTVYVDGRMMGFTPFEKELAPGLHGVRVRGSGARSWTEVVEMPAGSSRVVAPRFGLDRYPKLGHQEPGRVVLSGPLLLTVRISTPDGEPARNPRLHLPGLNAEVRDIPLSPVDMEEGTYIGMVDPRWIPQEVPVSYYFTVQTSSGETVTSDLYRLTVVRDIS